MVLLILVKNKRKKERKKEEWERWCDLVVTKKASENKREKKYGFEKAVIGNQRKEKRKLKETKRKF